MLKKGLVRGLPFSGFRASPVHLAVPSENTHANFLKAVWIQKKNLLYDALMISFLHNIIDIWNITLKYTLSGEVHSFKESHICHIPCKKLYIMITILNPVKELKVGVPRGGIFFNYFFSLHLIIVNRNLSSFLQRIFQLQLTPLDRNQSHAGIKSLVIVRMQFNTWLLVVATDLLINYYRTNREWRREFSYL